MPTTKGLRRVAHADVVKLDALFNFMRGISVVLLGNVALAIRSAELLLPRDHAISFTCSKMLGRSQFNL